MTEIGRQPYRPRWLCGQCWISRWRFYRYQPYAECEWHFPPYFAGHP